MKVAFTGHRPNKLGGYNDKLNYKKYFVKHVIEIFKWFTEPHIISGMALGVDTWAAQFAVWAKIPFTAYVPFEGQEGNWPKESRDEFNRLLKLATEVKYICPPGYSASKMQIRNEAMVDNCDILIAVWDGTPGGTGNCVWYAMEQEKTIIRINPLDNTITPSPQRT